MTAIDEEEFALMVGRFGTDVLRFARSQLPSMQDAEDVYQETFRTLYQRAPCFESDKHAKRWLLAVASNHCRHFYRTRERKGFSIFDAQSSMAQGLLEDRAAQSEPDYTPDHEVWDFVTRLPRAQREVIELFYVEGYSVDEIADIVHARPGTVRTRLFRARRVLRDAMKKGGDLGY